MESEFWARRPELGAFDAALLAAYYRARREAGEGQKISAALLREALAVVACEADWGLVILQAVDDYCLQLYRDELKRRRGAREHIN